MTDLQDNGSTAAPICSVCIANYNGAELIEECLNSVFSQYCNFPTEVIVHDDASIDGSIDIVRNQFPKAIVIRSANNAGFCISNNRMVAQARGKYILLLNNDAVLFPDALSTLIKEAERIGKPAILGLPQYDAKTGVLIDIGSLCDPFLNPIPNLNAARHHVAMVSGACLWIPRSLWEGLGGFPDWFESFAEDLYLCSLTRLNGYPVQSLGTSGFHHRVGHSFGGGRVNSRGLSTTYRRRILSERNKTFVMILSYPAPVFQIMFPIHLVMLLVEGAAVALLRRDGNLFQNIYWACLKSVWRERRRLAELRREIQAKRSLNLINWLSVFRPWPHKLKLLAKHGLPNIR